MPPDASKRQRIVPESSSDSSPKKYRKTQHRGVQLLPPDAGKRYWRARWRDPETRKILARTLGPADSKNHDTRTAYAVRIHRTLRRRNEDIAAGASPHTQAGMSLADAIASYYEKHDHPTTTRVDYEQATNALVAWGEENGVSTVRQLTPGKLREFSLALAKMPKKVRVKGGRRGEMRDGGKRSEWTVNKYRRNTGIVLNALRKLQIVRLTRDEIADSLERTKVKVKRREFLKPEQVAKLLECCEAHDAETFELCRDGSTDKPRYEPILPFVKFVLFTGMRVGEALQVLGSDVEGNELHVRAEVSKTKEARVVDLSVSTTLMEMKLHERSGVLWRLTEGELAAAKKRLLAMPGCPRWTWHGLRRTCGTYLTCAPAIYGAASAFMSAKRLGHSVTVAEKHYSESSKRRPTVLHRGSVQRIVAVRIERIR